jgi:hypothetical protein
MTPTDVNDYYIKKMCKYAGVNYIELEDKNNPWKQDITWSSEQMEEFREWMREDLKTHKMRRNAIMGKDSKVPVNTFVNMWIAAFGFVLEK